jgi:hypothetical protein
MTWNPVRFVETLVHFRVAGPLRSVFENLPFVNQAMNSPSLGTMLTPTPLPDIVLAAGLSPSEQDRLTTATTAMGYQVEALTRPREDELFPAAWPIDHPLVNVPLVIVSVSGNSDAAYESLSALVGALKQAVTITEANLVDLRHPTPVLKELWGALDDVVMGGVSSSQARWNDGLIFTGTVSTANSGGFASIRTRNVDPPINLAQWQGTVLHLKGDGQRYKWILRDSPGWDSLAYSRSFDTMVDTPITVHTRFGEMVATFRARTKPDASPLNPSQICSMQLMLSKFEYDGELNPTFKAGEFKLEVSRIGVFREAPKPLLLLPGIALAQTNGVGTLLNEANLMGIVPQPSGFEVVGAGDTLPAWISSERVSRFCQVFKTQSN